MENRILKVAFVVSCYIVSHPLAAQFLPSQSFEATSPSYLSALADLTPRFDTTQYLVVKESATELPVTVNMDELWKTWQLVENHTFGKDRGGIPMIADLQALHPYFRDKIIALIELCRAKGIELAVVESYRTHAKQSEYFRMGRKYTRSKGGKSKHQYGLAVDVVPVINGEAEWDDKLLWKKIGATGESLGLRWGGRWKAPYDPAHFEWTGGFTTYHLTSGTFPPVPKKENYPCIEEDLEFLQKSWEAWEVEQSSVARNARPAVPGR